MREVGEDAAAQNIRYLEIHFNPETNVRKRGLDFHEMLAGMNRGRAEARERWGVEMRWIADGVRDSETSPYSVTQTVDWIAPLPPEDGVVALGLGGNEVGHPPTPFAKDFARARAAGLHTVAHAGETTGPVTICDSLDLLARRTHRPRRARRREPRSRRPSGPGPRAIGALPDQQHLHRRCARASPIIRSATFDEAGVLVTVNSDDPPLFGTTLTDEFLVLARHWGYDADGIQRIALNAVDVSFLPADEKARMKNSFEEEFAALRQKLELAPAQT